MKNTHEYYDLTGEPLKLALELCREMRLMEEECARAQMDMQRRVTEAQERYQSFAEKAYTQMFAMLSLPTDPQTISCYRLDNGWVEELGRAVLFRDNSQDVAQALQEKIDNEPTEN